MVEIKTETETKAVMLIEQVKDIVEKELGRKILDFHYAPRTKVFVVVFENNTDKSGSEDATNPAIP